MDKLPVPKFAVLTGKAKLGTWSKGFRFLPSSEEASSKGTLLVNLSLTTMEKADLGSLAQRLVTSLHEGYFQDSNSTITESLKESLIGAQNQLKLVLPTLGVHSLASEIQLGVVLNQFLYLAKSGEELVYLKRGENFTPIKFNRVASGRLEAGDWLVLANGSFWQQVKPELFKDLVTQNFDGTLKSIDQLVGDKENISAILANFQIEEDLGDSEKVTLLDPSRLTTRPVTQIGKTVISILVFWVTWLFQKIKQFIKNSLGSFLSKKRPTAAPETSPVSSHRGKSSSFRQRGRLLLLVLIVLFSVGLFINLYFKNIATNRGHAAELVKAAAQDYSDAQSVASLNTTKAKDLLNSATQKLAEAKKLNKSENTANLENNIDNLLASLRREYRVAQLPLFYDLSFLKKGVGISSLSFDNDSLVALDKNQGTLILLDMKEKKGSVVVTDDRLKGATRLIVESNIGYILTTDEILRFDFFKKDFLTGVKTTEKVKDFQIYNGSLYILTATALKKAVLTSAGASSFNGYTTDKSIDFKTTQTLAVDGFVWAGTQNNLFKLSHGERVDFSLTGIEKPLKSIQTIYSSEATTYLYLVDTQNQRVVVIDKNGSYYSQYITPQLSEVTSLLADEAKNRLYVAANDKIYLLEVKKDSGGN